MELIKRQISHDDPNMIIQREFDPENDAKRVIIVGGTLPTFNVQGSSYQETKIEKIEVPVIITETKIVEIEKQVIVKEVQIERVEIPTYIVQKEIQEVIREVPVIQHEIKFIEIPVVIKEIQYKEMSNLVKCVLAVHALTTISLLLKLIFK